MQIRREHADLDRISEILLGIAKRERAAPGSVMDSSVSVMFRMTAEAVLRKDLRQHRADDPRLPALEAAEEKLRTGSADSFGSTAAMHLGVLPLPSLQRALTRRNYQISE